MTTPARPCRLPLITLTNSVYERLSELACAAWNRLPEVAEYLGREPNRARVVSDGALPPSTGTVGSHTMFMDCDTEQQRKVRPVWPLKTDASHPRLSVATPVGAALI